MQSSRVTSQTKQDYLRSGQVSMYLIPYIERLQKVNCLLSQSNREIILLERPQRAVYAKYLETFNLIKY